MSARLIALNRFGLGARVDEVRGVDDPRGWLLAQLDGPPPSLVAPGPAAADVSDSSRRFLEAGRSQDPTQLREAARAARSLMTREVGTLLATRVASDRPFAERWVAFWSNHLCVSSAAGPRVATLVGAYEREAIRPHVFGRFEDLLLASARHPAMLRYLNNAQSIGPSSLAARRRGRGVRRPNGPRGLNENYARELLELHTVGVDGGYSQTDVEQLARILTGWGAPGGGGPMRQGDGPVQFRFGPALHEPGAKTVLGVRYEEAGEDEGIRVIRNLAGHPETARFIATKLIRHFVDDEPPASAVERLADRWMDTGGDLRQVAVALVELDEAWDERHRKFRTPQDWLVAVLRAAALGPRNLGPNLTVVLRQLGQPVWAPSSPKGYGDLVREWADSDSLMNRAELSQTLAARFVNRRENLEPVETLASVLRLSKDDPLPGMLEDTSIPEAERLALAFAGPAFQWR